MVRILSNCLLMSLFLALPCMGQVLETEPNNDANSANALTSGVQIQGSFFSQSDDDYYKLSLSEQ